MKKTKQSVKKGVETRASKRRTQASSSVSRQVAIAREEQRSIDHFAGKTVTQKKAPKSTKGVVKRVERVLHPESDLGQWAKLLSRPFEFEGIFCPVSYNPAPSFIQSTARTTCTALSASVVAGTTTQYVFWPGHYRPAAPSSIQAGMSDMDAVSYHAMDVTINTGGGAGRYVVGPMNKRDNSGVKTAICGAVTSSMFLNSMYDDLNTAGSLPMGWDVPLPYESDARSYTGHHSRWQLVAMGLRFRQTTPELNRGGTFITVQPNNHFRPVNSASQSTLEQFPTFMDHGPEGFEISWIPRAQDLAFWHGTGLDSSSGADISAQGGAVYVFVNNPGAEATSHNFQVVCHWQLAGSYLNTVGRPGAHAPETKPAVEKAISFLQNGAHTASQAAGVLEKAVGHSGSSTAGTWYDTAMKAYGVGKKVIPRLAGAI